ncbi:MULTISPECIES: class I SAM-dependent methyltransferase [unclassified Solibacillus]|uniref:class I SAM-dependent methyltransferase n=1 Tax=unclassified Solibacillus TaxID=2637870 RepID=UPI0030F64364
MSLTDPTTISSWLRPHSIEWYQQLSDIQGKYTYSWESTLSEPNGDSIFDEEVTKIITNKKVLDVGCGHGDFTKKNGLVAKEIIGFDVTNNFIKAGLENKPTNVSFVLGSTKESLPFEMNEFDCAYIRKGPTSAYPLLSNIVKKGGKIIGLHPGDDTNQELPNLFPNLFENSIGTPILDNIQQRLELSNFSYFSIEVINSTEFIHTPIDILKLRCFGQHPSIYETLRKKDLQKTARIFEQHATERGLPITFSRYVIRVTV